VHFTMTLLRASPALSGVVEFLADLLLLGALTSIVAMLFALWTRSTAWLAVGRMKKKHVGGCELDIIPLLTALALAAIADGRLSLDYFLRI